MRKNLLLWLLAIPLFAQGAETDMTTGSYWYLRCSGGINNKVQCVPFVLGVTTGAQVHAAVTESRPLFCIPSGADMGQLVDVFLNYMERRPEFRHHSAALIVLRSVADAFPCPAK